MIDELDALIGTSKDSITALLQVPVYAPKTVLIGPPSPHFVGIANSLGFFANMLDFYAKFPSHKAEQLIFEAYTSTEIEKIIRGKLQTLSEIEGIEEAIISKDALRHLGAKVASISGDIRIAFDICKTVLLDHVNNGTTTPVQLCEIVQVLNLKYKSKLVEILHQLPRDHQMLAAAIYVKMQAEHKEFFKYDDVTERVERIRYTQR